MRVSGCRLWVWPNVVNEHTQCKHFLLCPLVYIWRISTRWENRSELRALEICCPSKLSTFRRRRSVFLLSRLLWVRTMMGMNWIQRWEKMTKRMRTHTYICSIIINIFYFRISLSAFQPNWNDTRFHRQFSPNEFCAGSWFVYGLLLELAHFTGPPRK